MLALAKHLRCRAFTRFLALLVALANVLTGLPAYAQATSGVVTIRVTDAESKSPVPLRE